MTHQTNPIAHAAASALPNDSKDIPAYGPALTHDWEASDAMPSGPVAAPRSSAPASPAQGSSRAPAGAMDEPPLLVDCPWAPAFPIAGADFPSMAYPADADFFPALAARSALFGARGKAGARHAVEIPVQGKSRLFFQGEPLGMTDKRVWEIAMAMAKAAPCMPLEMEVCLSDFAKAMGSNDRGGDALRRVWASLERLARCHLDVEFPDGSQCAGFMLGTARIEGRRKWIAADPALAGPLFAWGSQFRIQSERRALLASALARWLHDFLSTHSNSNRPMTVGYLRGLSGFGGQRKEFPDRLDAALKDLAVVAPNLLAGHSIAKSKRASDGWTVSLVRGPEKAKFVGSTPAVASQAASPPKAAKKGLAL